MQLFYFVILLSILYNIWKDQVQCLGHWHWQARISS